MSANGYDAYMPTGTLFFLSSDFISTALTAALAVLVLLYFLRLIKCKEINRNKNRTSRTETNREDTFANKIEMNNRNGQNIDDDDVPMDGLVGKLKTARLKKELAAQLTEDQLAEERRIEREQLAAIYELLKKQESELNTKEINETELSAQMNLYR
ncbi:uncharacterized protein LOC119669027 isoform X1 [Teleopsis dalmanni]|uniref:uncharacterized protein LOC119669027 isoform X1 n=1 Tax=Teleopsis dalmanni TaxID=139649 RepID=UPI0018CE722A|nr:uncharacterized protein LOC119669027 isoform X1 [Teleopsis dalmanni]